MSAAVTAIEDVYATATPLDVLRAWSAELNTALGAHNGWQRLDGASFVSASRDAGKVSIIGNSGGWWLVRPDYLPGGVREDTVRYSSAVEAVLSLSVAIEAS